MRSLALSAVFLGLLGVLVAGSSATAEEPEIRRHGAACPPAGCPGAPRSSGASALGFGAVVLATGLIARRRAAEPR